ncbi:MAG: hypothetical protein Kow00108_01690 [Calditrichia bacterium]
MKMVIKTGLLFILLFLWVTSVQAGLQDRAFATHTVNKVGFFTTNIGQFYPYGGQFEKTIEYPINSGRIAMYRQCIMIGAGLPKVNVISAADGRYEEFDAIGGYHNPAFQNIAISNDPTSWPEWGWPVRDVNNTPVIQAEQVSYCVYSDSTNWRYYTNGETDMLMDIRVHQSIWSWGVKDAEKFHILKFDIVNEGSTDLREMYFNFYSDLDIGGNEEEWDDDCIDFDKERELVYFYDADNFSDEWQESDPFMVGIVFFDTPNNQGITDFHWIDVSIDEVRVNNAVWDSVSYYLMKSDTSFFANSPDFNTSDYFHLGNNPINGTHFDDPATTRITDDQGNLVGGAMVAYICNGPFDLLPGDTATILVGIVVGDNKDDLITNVDKMWEYHQKGWKIPVIPRPNVTDASASDRRVILQWDNEIDLTYENNTVVPPINDLEGYIVYRTTDQQLRESSWEALDTIPMIYKDDSSYRSNAYEFVDEQVFNGFDYIYSVVAYRRNLAGVLEESAKLGSLDDLVNTRNAVMISPQTMASTTKKELDRIKVVPNPFVVSAQWDTERLGNAALGEPVRNIAFTHLPERCKIYIYSIDGDLIKTIDHYSSNGREEWNLLTSENRPVVSGIYFYHVKSDLGDKTGRFAIIR